MNKLKKKVEGITLVALVVTIIVLLILAGVAINLSIGNNGLFTRAQNAVDVWEKARQEEQNKLDDMYSSIKVASDSEITLTMKELDKYIEDKIKENSNDEQILSDISSFSLDDSIEIYDGRIKVTEGGYKIVGKYMYIYIKAEYLKTLNASGGWIIFKNFPEPKEITSFDVASESPGPDTVIAWAGITSSGTIHTNSTMKITSGTKLIIKGKYELATNDTAQ